MVIFNNINFKPNQEHTVDVTMKYQSSININLVSNISIKHHRTQGDTINLKFGHIYS